VSRWIDAGRDVLAQARAQPRGSGIRGVIGDALFACALDPADAGASHEWIQAAIDDLETHGTEVSLHRGIAGLGWVVAAYRPDEEDLLAYVDEVTAARLDAVPPASLQSGVAGIALYASLRSATESGRGLQRAVVERLRETATASEGGVVWTTPAAYMRGRGVEVPGEPVVEYGMVHGIGGTLVALAASGGAAAADLVRAGIHAAWAHAKPEPNRFGRILFGPRGSLGTREWEGSRWCVGDPGVLRALWLASRSVGDVASAERALASLRSDAARDSAGEDRLEGRLDLCCGASAVAQVYMRMHRETGEAVFRAANRAMLARCAEGYDRLPDVSFAYGKMGVVLALLAAERDDDPSWDGVLGMSLPAAAAAR
jgi:hypothetical protein